MPHPDNHAQFDNVKITDEEYDSLLKLFEKRDHAAADGICTYGNCTIACPGVTDESSGDRKE